MEMEFNTGWHSNLVQPEGVHLFVLHLLEIYIYYGALRNFWVRWFMCSVLQRNIVILISTSSFRRHQTFNQIDLQPGSLLTLQTGPNSTLVSPLAPIPTSTNSALIPSVKLFPLAMPRIILSTIVRRRSSSFNTVLSLSSHSAVCLKLGHP